MSDSDSDILSTSDAFTSTHKLAVEVLTAAWTIRPEGEDIDDIADLLGVHLERAVYEEIARGLAEVACVPHDQMRDQLRVAAQQEFRRRAFPSYQWATTTEVHPVRYRSSLHMGAHLLDAHLEQMLQRPGAPELAGPSPPPRPHASHARHRSGGARAGRGDQARQDGDGALDRRGRPRGPGELRRAGVELDAGRRADTH